MPTKKEKLANAIKSGIIKDEKTALEFILKEKVKENLIKEIISEVPTIKGDKGEKGDAGKDGIDGKNGINGKDGKTPVINTSKIISEAQKGALEAIKDKIPTIPQITEQIPLESERVRDALELLTGDERLSKDAINGLDEFATKKQLDGLGGSTARNFYQLLDTGSYSGQAGKVVKVKADETGLEYSEATDTDEKVKLNALDPTAGYLDDKIVESNSVLLLDQTTPQSIVNGIPVFNEGWQSNKWYRNGLGTTLEIHTRRDDAFDAIATSTTDAGALTSIRTNMNRGTAAATTILNTNAYRLWIGHNQPFNTVGMWIVTGASANTTIVEYWNGTAWAEVPNKTDGTSNLSGPGTITFDIPEDWATLDKDGEARYWLKFRTNVSTATDATVQLIQPIAYTAHDLFNFLPNPLDIDTSNGIFINTFGKVKIPRISGAVAVEGAVSAVSVAVGGALSGATTVAHSGLLTGTLSGATETPIVGHYLLGAATTGVTAALVPTRYSPSLRLTSRSWDIDGAVDRVHHWQIDSAPYAGNEPSSRLRITHGTGYTNLVNLSDDGTASFLGTTYGDEVLSNGEFTGGTSWSAANGFSLASNTAVYVHNAAGGTLTQASGDFATPLLPNRWYRLTYTTSAINTTARMYIGSEVSVKEREYLQGTLVAGTYTQWFKTNSSPGDFVIYADSAAAGDGFTLDDISLVPVISGDVEAMGTIWGQGYYSADRTAGASAVTGGLTFKNGLYTAGTATSISFGTTTQIPYMNVGGTDFLYSDNLKFDGNILRAANFYSGPVDPPSGRRFWLSNTTNDVTPLTLYNRNTYTSGTMNVMDIIAVTSNIASTTNFGASLTFYSGSSSTLYPNQIGAIAYSNDGGVSTGKFLIRPALNSSIKTRMVVHGNGDVEIPTDNAKLLMGTGSDASIYYDATNLIINPKEVGTGYLNIKGQVLVDDKIMFTQTDGNEYIDSLNDGYVDIGATEDVRINSNLDVTGIQKYENAFTFTLDASASTDAVTFPTAFGTGVTPVIICTVPYQTSFWITDITNTGFTFNVGTTNAYAQTIHCIVMETS